MPDKQEISKKLFITVFNELAYARNPHSIFRDFLTVAMASLHNSVLMDQEIENEYLEIAKNYGRDDLERFASLLGMLVVLQNGKPGDVLGDIYAALELTNAGAGQFFTPFSISEMIAKTQINSVLQIIEQKGFVTLCEPACGSGGMVLAVVGQLIEKRHDPAQTLWVQCTDIDRLCVNMIYIQFALWNVPAEIIWGDTLSGKVYGRFFTPAHHIYGWRWKLTRQVVSESANALENPVVAEKPVAVSAQVNPLQFDLRF